MCARRVIALSVAMVLVLGHPAAADVGNGTVGGGSGGSAGSGGITSVVDEPGGGSGGGSGGGGAPVCTSWWMTNGEVGSIASSLGIGASGAAGDYARVVNPDGSVLQVVGTSCVPGGTSISLVPIVDGAAVTATALSRVPWPDFTVSAIPDDAAISGFEMGLGLTGAVWEPIQATASASGMTVTVTATPREVRWFTGGINSLVSGDTDDDYTVCPGVGLEGTDALDTSCTFVWRSSSAGLVDDLGEEHRVTLRASIVWDLSYVSNIPSAVRGPATFTVDYERHGFPVTEIHSISTSG